MQKKALGRGLDSLISGGFVATVAAEPPHTPATIRPLGVIASVSGAGGQAAGTAATTTANDGIRHLDIAVIDRSRFQPRSEFDPEQLRELSDSIEEARAYEQLATQFKLTQEQIAEKVGRNRATVANAMRLLALPGDVLSWVADGKLSVGHAKAILGLTIAEEQKLVAERVLKRNLTGRETERIDEQSKGAG